MNTLPDEIWLQIIGNDWRVYAGLLAIPKFARLTFNDVTKWKKFLTIQDRYRDGIEWTLCGKRHRDDDLPAAITVYGDQEWYQYGKCHRSDDLPAVIWIDGSREWLRHGKYHRDGGLPAVIWMDGQQEWWIDGVRQQTK